MSPSTNRPGKARYGPLANGAPRLPRTTLRLPAAQTDDAQAQAGECRTLADGRPAEDAATLQRMVSEARSGAGGDPVLRRWRGCSPEMTSLSPFHRMGRCLLLEARCRHEQSLEPQGTARTPVHRVRRCTGALPAALQSRLQPDRECPRQIEGAAPQGRRANPRRPMGHHPPMAGTFTPAECANYFAAAGYDQSDGIPLYFSSWQRHQP